MKIREYVTLLQTSLLTIGTDTICEGHGRRWLSGDAVKHVSLDAPAKVEREAGWALALLHGRSISFLTTWAKNCMRVMGVTSGICSEESW